MNTAVCRLQTVCRSNFLGHKGLMAEALGKLANQMWCSDKGFLRPSEFKEQVG